MNDLLATYFAQAEGTGVLATADRAGRVNLALYSRPHCLPGGELAFIMADRKSHANLRENPHAAYLFREEGGGARGKRLLLTMTGESEDPAAIAALRRSQHGSAIGERRFLVSFRLERELPLLGADEA